MPEMSLMRKEDLSLYYHIKDVIFQSFMEREEYIPLEMMDELCTLNSYVYAALTDMVPSPTERGRGWVYFDSYESGDLCFPYSTVSGTTAEGDPTTGTPEQSNRVTVYETSSSGTLDAVTDQEYMIDYIDGRIITDSRLSNPYVSYYWHYISVVDEWAAIEAADPPVVVIDIHGIDKAGYQLGGGKKTTRKVDIHIFASDPAERNDIAEAVYDGLYNRSCPLYDFPTGGALDYDGTFYGRGSPPDKSMNKLETLFSRDRVNLVNRLYFDNVTSRHVNLPLIMSRGRNEVMLSDLNAYRSKVSFDMFSYDDRSLE